MKKEIGLMIIALFLLIQTTSAITPIENNITIQGLPETIIAGSECETHYQFHNIKPISIAIFFNISNQQVPVNYNDFSVNISLNNEELNCSEIGEGIFKCNEYNITTIRTNDLKVSFTSKINLQPAENYTFQLSGTIRYEEEKKVKIEEKIYFEGGGGGGGNLQRDTDRDGICDWFEEIRGSDPNNPCDPDSECKACLALKQKQPALNETSVVEAKITPTPTPTPTPEIPTLVVKEPFQWKFIPIPIGIGIAVILFLIWRRREDEDEGYEYEYEEEEQ